MLGQGVKDGGAGLGLFWFFGGPNNKGGEEEEDEGKGGGEQGFLKPSDPSE